MRLRAGKWCWLGGVPGGYSLTSVPSFAIRRIRAPARRRVRDVEPRSEDREREPFAESAPSCAAASMPRAAPLTTVTPASASPRPIACADSLPRAVHRRAPTTATPDVTSGGRAVRSRRSPRADRRSGGAGSGTRPTPTSRTARRTPRRPRRSRPGRRARANARSWSLPARPSRIQARVDAADPRSTASAISERGEMPRSADRTSDARRSSSSPPNPSGQTGHGDRAIRRAPSAGTLELRRAATPNGTRAPPRRGPARSGRLRRGPRSSARPSAFGRTRVRSARGGRPRDASRSRASFEIRASRRATDRGAARCSGSRAPRTDAVDASGPPRPVRARRRRTLQAARRAAPAG